MNGFYRLILKMIILICPFYVLCPIAVSKFPMRFLDYEYSSYLQNKEYSDNHDEYARVLIMGDSTAKASWIPEELSDDTYNFSLAGTSPIEEYYYLYDYLQHNVAPEYLIYTQNLGEHFLIPNYFWSRSVYFHRINGSQLEDLYKTLLSCKDTDYFKLNDWNKEIMAYKMYSPTKYSVAFINGCISSKRYEKNLERYKSVAASKGQTFFGTAEFCDDLNPCVEYESFRVNDCIDRYVKKIIKLCDDNNIKFIYQNPPLNEASYNKLQKGFVNDYTDYLKCLQERFPNAIIDTEIINYSNSYFGDVAHLNRNGALLFAKEMKEKYPEIFINSVKNGE